MSLSSLNPAKLDRLITPRYPIDSRGTAGSVVQSWVASATQSWAQWLPTTGREYQAAAAAHAETTGVLRIRYRSDILPTWRVLLDGALYDILAVLEVGRRSFLDVLVKTSPASASVTASAQVFEVSLAEGDIQAVITYPAAFASSPRGIYISQVIPAGGFTFTYAIVDGSRTASGCTIDLGAAVPAAGYKLSFQVTL